MKSLWALMIVLSLSGTAEAFKDWNGIVPCVSTRLDAEKILGREDDPPINLGVYMYEKFRVHVRYERNDKGFPEKDLVERIDVYPDKAEPLAKYVRRIANFAKDFRKTELPDSLTHVNSLAVYRNWNEGFEIWVQKDGKGREIITRFGYFDPAYSCSKILPSASTV